MITDEIKKIINKSLVKNNFPMINYDVDQSKFIQFGDFNTNVAMVLKRDERFKNTNPLEIAKKIVNEFNEDIFQNIEIVKPGFINFTLKDKVTKLLFETINEEQGDFPKFPKKHETASIEYVSANPTGYLHIGHARGAVYGEVCARLYEKIGYDVIRDYVVNDAGNQMNVLATSVLIRYWQILGKKVELFDESYHGEEIIAVAKKLKEKYGDDFIGVKLDENHLIEDKEIRAKIRWFARNYLLDQIKLDLAKLDVYMDEYFSEQSTHDEPERLKKILEMLKNELYEKDGALWFASTKYGDDKDRVLVKSNGEMTYFLPDIYYHNYKLTRNSNTTTAVTVLGSDHYGYELRIKAVLKALGHKNIDENYKIPFIQMVKLLKNGEEFKMSKRSGKSLRLIDLVDALGKEIAKWNLIAVSNNNHLEIDVDKATREDGNNIYYYIKYAVKRATKILEQNNFQFKDGEFDKLNDKTERSLINNFHFFKETIVYSAENLDVQKLVNYVITLARLFHVFAEQNKWNNEQNNELQKKLTIVYCFKIVILNALKLLNINVE